MKGFTLLEVIAVLVILGILAAVAVPKYFDMQEDAELAAAQSVVAELNSRVQMSFAKQKLFNGSDGYSGFDGAVVGWTTGITNTPATATIKRNGSTGTGFSANWVGGSAGSPGYFDKATAS